MKTVLVISSFVAASRVGATASAFCLRRLGVEVVILPTTLMGRHPGWGNPGGGATDTRHLRDMWEAIRKQDLIFDGVLSGYMGTEEHVNLACEIISDIKNKNPKAQILVDPVMGDNGSLYIAEAVAFAVRDKLLPIADIVTPNVWELSFLTELENAQIPTLLKTARKLAPLTLVTSVEDKENIGAVLVNQDNIYQVSHKRYATVPHGGGDSLAATFLAHLLSGKTAIDAMERSVASIFAVMSAANILDAGELPLIREQAALIEAKPLKSRFVKL